MKKLAYLLKFAWSNKSSDHDASLPLREKREMLKALKERTQSIMIKYYRAELGFLFLLLQWTHDLQLRIFSNFLFLFLLLPLIFEVATSLGAVGRWSKRVWWWKKGSSNDEGKRREGMVIVCVEWRNNNQPYCLLIQSRNKRVLIFSLL